MTIDIKWPVAILIPFALMAWVEVFVWVFGFEWTPDTREAVAIFIFILGGFIALFFIIAAYENNVRWNVRLPFGNTQDK